MTTQVKASAGTIWRSANAALYNTDLFLLYWPTSVHFSVMLLFIWLVQFSSLSVHLGWIALFSLHRKCWYRISIRNGSCNYISTFQVTNYVFTLPLGVSSFCLKTFWASAVIIFNNNNNGNFYGAITQPCCYNGSYTIQKWKQSKPCWTRAYTTLYSSR